MSKDTGLVLGIDIGTTSISAVLISSTEGRNITTYSRAHKADIPPDRAGGHLQNPETIVTAARSVVDEIIDETGDVRAIGVTGQMHSVTVVDNMGAPVSPIYTWLDQRLELPIGSQGTGRKLLRTEFGEDLPAGYGIGTIYSLIKSKAIPEKAYRLISVPDLVTEQLVSRDREVMRGVTTQSLAHSLGCFDIAKSRFRKAAQEMVGGLLLPEVVPSGSIVGKYQGKIPVIAAEGDNQAGFIAIVRDPDKAFFINIGTSGQISFKVGLDFGLHSKTVPGLEIRPLIGKSMLAVGATLGGGKSFSLLSNLVQEIASEFDEVNGAKIFDSLSNTERPDSENRLIIDPRFFGSREEPKVRGSIDGISGTNFDLRSLYWGIADGVAQELYELTKPYVGRLNGGYLCASGNAVDRSPVLRQALSDRFDAPVRLLAEPEASARGIALVALSAVEGGIDSLQKLQASHIHYQSEMKERSQIT